MKGDSCEDGAMTMGVARVAKTGAISPSALGRKKPFAPCYQMTAYQLVKTTI